MRYIKTLWVSGQTYQPDRLFPIHYMNQKRSDKPTITFHINFHFKSPI